MKSSLNHIITVCIIGAIVFLIHGFLYTVIAKKSTAVANLQNQIDIKREKINSIISSRVALAEIAKDEAIVKRYFVSENDIVAFINDLQTRGVSQGAVVKVLSVSAGTASIKSSLVFALTVTGTFDAVMRTIGMIEYAPYNITISKFSISKDEKIWKADVELIVGSISTKP